MQERPPLRRKYRTDFLKKVVVRVDFATENGLDAGGPPNDVVSILKRGFPILESRTVVQRAVHITSSGTREEVNEFPVWDFHAKNRTKKLVLSHKFLTLEYETYDCFETLIQDFELALIGLQKSQTGSQSRRIGLRYIDNVDIPKGPPTEWSEYFDGRLLNGFHLYDRDQMSRVLQVIEWNYGDWRQRFQYGMPNADYPSVIRKKVFVLDMDAYSDLTLDVGEFRDYLEKFHSSISALFETVITEKLRKKMGIRSGG